MIESNLIKKLLTYKLATLSKLAVICGIVLPNATKDVKIQYFIDSYKFYMNNYDKNSQNRSVLGIDVGVKHFSYCKSIGSVDTAFPVKVTEWSKINLDERFGKNYQPILNKDSMVDNKRYFEFITRSLVDQLKPNDSDVVVMEAQRTRSTINTSTLPQVLLSYNLENLIISNAYPKIIIPMTAFQMSNYWIHRFVAHKSVNNAIKNRKGIRFQFIRACKDKLYELPGYGNDKLDKKKILEYLNLNTNDKIDDLTDSLLYNLTIHSQFQNLKEFHQLISNDYQNCDLQEFIDMKDEYHLELLDPIIKKYELSLK